MTYKLDLPNKQLIQQPEMERPNPRAYAYPSLYVKALQAYNKHTDSLLTLTLLSIPEGWVDGQELINGKDFYVVYVNGDHIAYPHPIPPAQEGKEEKGEAILKIIKDESEKCDVRKYTCINGFGYSQFERNIADRILILFTPSPSESNSNEGYWKSRCEWAELCITRLESCLPYSIESYLKSYDCYAQWQSLKQSSPIVQEQEDDLWKEAGEIIMGGYEGSPELTVIELLKNKFTITKK